MLEINANAIVGWPETMGWNPPPGYTGPEPSAPPADDEEPP